MITLNPKLLRKIVYSAAFAFLATPLSLLAQGSPDIIWQRQVSVDRVNSVIFTPDGNTLISGGSVRLINFWRVSDGVMTQTLNTNAPFVHESAIESLSISPDGSQLASATYKVVQLWDIATGTQRKLNGHTDWVVGVAFSPDGNLLASASFDTTVRIWRASDGALVKTLAGSGQQRCVAWSPDGSLIALTTQDNSVQLWQTSDWTVVRTMPGHSDDVFTVAFSPDGNTIASGGYDDTVKLWNVADGALKFTFGGNGGNVYSVAFTPDGSKVAYTDGEGSTVKIYNVADGTLARMFDSEVNEVQTLAFSRNGLLGYGRVDETVVLARIDGTATPRARITSPSIGATYNSPANITIVAAPSKPSGSIEKMEFFQNGVKLGEDLVSPYSFNWTDVAAGTYVLTVVDTDLLGATTGSGPITITVVDKSNAPPSIVITSPKSGANFSAPGDINITATASASAGVANVEFFQNGISLGQDTAAPFTMSWETVPIGNYSLTAVVTDKAGAMATSIPVDITVKEAPPEAVKPRVAIASPAAGAKLTSSEITIQGTASDNVGVARVWYSLNSAPFQSASGTQNWSVNLTLIPGVNVVQVKSEDVSGNESAVVSRTFTYIVSAPIGITINGSGAVSIKDGQILEVGKTYTIKAIPSRDFVFNSWTGTITTNALIFSFVMTEGMNLTANFVPNPFAEVQGTYYGLIQPTNFSHGQSGFLKINATRLGTFSGKMTFAGKNYSLSGRFKGDGSFNGTQSRSSLVLDFLIHLNDDSDQITGSISDGIVVSSIIADRMVYNAQSNPAGVTGKYTLLIPPNSAASDSPQGNGFGIVKVEPDGKTRVSGSLADGTKFSQAAGISKSGNWPLYAPLYRNGGSISGPIQFRNQIDVSDLDGTINWFRPAISTSKIFADGFETQSQLLGSAYQQPVGRPALAVPSSEENVLVNLGEGDLESELQKTATLENNNQIVVPDSNDEKLRLSISASSGALRGSFVHPVTRRVTRHNGVVFQKQNLAEGYFLGTDQSGFVSVVPADGSDAVTEPIDPVEEPPISEEPLPEPDPTPRKKKH